MQFSFYLQSLILYLYKCRPTSALVLTVYATRLKIGLIINIEKVVGLFHTIVFSYVFLNYTIYYNLVILRIKTH